jgi:hypothetical protein
MAYCRGDALRSSIGASHRRAGAGPRLDAPRRPRARSRAARAVRDLRARPHRPRALRRRHQGTHPSRRAPGARLARHRARPRRGHEHGRDRRGAVCQRRIAGGGATPAGRDPPRRAHPFLRTDHLRLARRPQAGARLAEGTGALGAADRRGARGRAERGPLAADAPRERARARRLRFPAHPLPRRRDRPRQPRDGTDRPWGPRARDAREHVDPAVAASGGHRRPHARRRRTLVQRAGGRRARDGRRTRDRVARALPPNPTRRPSTTRSPSRCSSSSSSGCRIR